MDLHLTDCAGAFVAAREVLVGQLRGYGSEWTNGVYAESRGISTDLDALEFIRSAGLAFGVVVLAEEPEVLFDDDEARTRRYRPAYLLVFVQKFTDGDGEDAFAGRVERAALYLAAQATIAVTLASGITVEFRVVALDAVLKCDVIHNTAGEIIGHSAIRRIVLEVTACAT